MKRLYRSRRENMIGGVAAGLAEYMQIDPVIVRISFVLLTFVSGIGLLAYILLLILVPREPVGAYGTWSAPADTEHRTTPARSATLSVVLGISLIVVGAITLAENFIPDLDLSRFWPIVLIALGTSLLLRSLGFSIGDKEQRQDTAQDDTTREAHS